MSYIGKQPEFTQYPSKFFDGDGSAMTVTLDYAPPNDAALLVFIDGVRQDTSAYNCTGTSCVFTGSVPSGTANVQVVHLGLTVDVGVPGDDTITTVKIQDDAVTAAKLANSINTEIAANTAKVTNATHTGDVTGATALTIAADAVDIAMLSATGTASSSTFLRGDNAWVAPTGGLFSSYAIICDQKSSGTVSGTFTSGSYQTRDLNTEITDPDGIVSISSNEFTLDAGSYLIEWSAPAQWVTAHKSRLYDVTGTAEVQLGAPEYSHSTYPTSNVSLGSARVSPSGSNAYRIEHRCQTTRSTNGFGNAASFGDNEIYTIVRIFKES